MTEPRRVLAYSYCALLSLAIGLAGPVSALTVEAPSWTPGTGSAQPSVTSAGDGQFALTWQQRAGEQGALRVAVFAASAAQPARVSDVASGKNWFLNWADFPSLAVLDNGDWVTFTLRKSAGSTYAYDIHLQRSLDAGRTWLPSVVVNRDGQSVQHGFVSLLPDGEDRVLLVWLDGREGATDAHAHHGDHEEGRMTLRAAVVGRNGVSMEEARLDADTCSCCQTDMVRRGRSVAVVYRDHAEGVRDIAMLRRDAAGAWQHPSTVYADQWRMPGCPVNGPASAVNGSRLAVLWPTMAEGPLDVKLAISAAEGEGFAKPVLVERGESVLGRVDLAPWRDGGFLATWVGADGADAVLRVAEVDAQGRMGERRDVERLPPGRNLGHPRLASAGDKALLTWTEPHDDGPRVRIAWISP